MLLTLNDGRKELYQWDIGRTATVDIDCDEVHFSNLKYGDALVVEVRNGEVEIPNQLLKSGASIYCWAFEKSTDGRFTKTESEIEVIKRPKPSDYVYTETEVKTIESVVDEALQEAKESGDFKGDKGDKGDTGNGIAKIEKTNAEGLVDTYTITFTDGKTTTFTVTNGKKGDKGDKGDLPRTVDTIEINGTAWQRTKWSDNKYEARCKVSPTETPFTVTFPNTLKSPFVLYNIMNGAVTRVSTVTTTDTFTMSYGGEIKDINISVFADINSYWEKLVADGLVIVDGNTLVSVDTSVEGELYIPDTITSIAEQACDGCSKLSFIRMSDYTTSWGKVSFKGTGITGIEISNSVTEIPNNAFQSCKNLKKLDVPASITEIKTLALDGCEALEEVNFASESNVLVYNNVFRGCHNLKKIKLSGQFSSGSKTPFGSCTGLTFEFGKESVSIILGLTGGARTNFQEAISKAIFSDGVLVIGKHALNGCKNLESVDISNSVNTIDAYAFSCCENLKSISIPNSVTSIGSNAFEYCTNLTSVSIPNSVTSIGSEAFRFCTSLKSISIPNGVTTINRRTFFRCEGLESVTIPDSVTRIGDLAFNATFKLKSVILPEIPPILEGVNTLVGSTQKNFYVPTEESKAAYESATNWAQYAGDYIVGTPPTEEI